MLRCFLIVALLFIALMTKAAAETSAVPAASTPAKIECKLVFSKIPCWKGYTVFVEMIDAVTQKALQNFELKGKDLSTTIVYDCQKHPQINFRTHYSPNIWKGDENKIYLSTKVWDIASGLAELPDAASADATTTTFTISATFPTNFSEVPSPTICDQGKTIPKIPTH
ncbi:hypothetical protein BH10PSE19_BH10PSE19_02730 [soil metagenome]